MKTVLNVLAAASVILLSACAGQGGDANQTDERSGVINLAGQPLTLLGSEVKVGQKAPDFKLVTPYDEIEKNTTALEIALSQTKGNVRFISVVPSLDTPVCDLQTQQFEEQAHTYHLVNFFTISMDLPFAQARYCGSKDVSHMQVLSDYRDGSFGRSYGVLIKELNLLSRAIFIIDETDTVRYVQYVKDISQPPDYDAALAALRTVTAAGSPVTPAPGVTTQRPPETTITQSRQVGNKAGNLAPDFKLKNLDGKEVSLSDYRGKPVMLNFWVTWCPHCQAERPLVQKLSQEAQSRGLVLLTVDILGTRTTETPANLADFMQKNNYTFPVLLDEGMKVTKTYGIQFTPTNFLIDKDGVIKEVRTGPFPSDDVLEESLKQLIGN